MDTQKTSWRLLWKIVAFAATAWIGSLLVFSDLCLSFGGGGRSSCKSTFEYPDFVAGLAIVGAAVLGPVLLLLGTVASVLTFVGWWRNR